jgi:feruloyl esterase
MSMVFLLGVSCSGLFAADCGALKNLALENTTIVIAETVSAGTLTNPEDGKVLGGLPAFCRVEGVMRPSGDSRIRFEVWLPVEWNGRLLGAGNGGFAGSLPYRQLVGYVKRGFAVASSDTGHRAEGTDASWAYGHPEKVKDFGWRAVHLTTERAKQLIAVYYGKPQEKAYFDACSDGGREALMEAQRFPEDYDGILAGAPVNAWSTMLAAGVTAMQTLGDPHAYISDLKLPAIERASLAACDALDGVKDGIINNPAKCSFDPEVLRCKGEETLECLTQPQVDALRSLYQGARDGRGEVFFPGLAMGDETGWSGWIMGADPEASISSRYVRNYFRYFVADPKWNALTADVDASLRTSRQKSAADLDATDPDMSRFAAHGGKLILYHGWNDPAVSPWNTITYYQDVRKTMGDRKADAFARLYMVPGMEHCEGGPGASALGQMGIPTAKGPDYGLFDSLQSWVEKGSPAEDVTATKYSRGDNGAQKPVMTRPLCAYPRAASYKGAGDTNDASSFTCVEP